MPYIAPQLRDQLAPHSERRAVDTGELNFQISYLLNDYMRFYGINYAMLNNLIGVLECAKLELYRRMAAPYEDVKLNENGDIF